MTTSSPRRASVGTSTTGAEGVGVGRRRRSRILRLGAAAAVLISVGVAGCTPPAGVAVKVGSQTVTMDTYNADVANCSSLASSDTMTPREVIASTEVQGAIGEELLAKSGRTLTTRQRDALMASNQLSALSSHPACRAMGRRLVTLYAVAGTTPDAQTLIKAVKGIDVKVNPRLGDWYPDQLTVAGTGSLSNVWQGARS